MTTTEPDNRTLTELITAFHTTYAALESADPDRDQGTDSVEWGAWEDVEHAIVRYPCRTLDDVRVKARFFLENEGAYDTIRTCENATEETLYPFLRSLLGEEQS